MFHNLPFTQSIDPTSHLTVYKKVELKVSNLRHFHSVTSSICIIAREEKRIFCQGSEEGGRGQEGSTFTPFLRKVKITFLYRLPPPQNFKRGEEKGGKY